jgi:hypothetical protein
MTKAKAATKPAARDPLEEAAEREALRGAKIGALAQEAKMWRSFAGSCKDGRYISEHYAFAGHYSPLSVTMDEITAKSWRAFAESMAGIAEQRLREILG